MIQSVLMFLRKIRMHKDCIVIMGMKYVDLLNGEKGRFDLMEKHL